MFLAVGRAKARLGGEREAEGGCRPGAGQGAEGALGQKERKVEARLG